MAKKNSKSNDDTKKTTVKRVAAKDDRKSTKKPASTKKAVALNSSGTTKIKKGALSSFLGYFTGAWYELRQVRWPSRRATWSMTGALLMFTAIFIGFILLIDFVFENLFTLILGN